MAVSRREFTLAAAALGVATTLGPAPALASPSDMIVKAIPSSGENVPVIGLGTNRYGVDASETARAPLRDALRRFHELGGTVIDTAPMYGTSETVLGDLMTGLGITDDMFIATKTDRSAAGEATAQQMRESGTKIETETVDLMQVHNLIDWRNALPVLHEWKTAGRVRYIGVTTSRTDQYGDVERVMRDEDLDFLQVNYSLEQQTAADRLLPLAADRGMAVMINRAFGGGRIFAAVGEAPLPEWAGEFGATSWAQFLLKYAVSHPAATVAIPGMTKVRHVEDNLQAARGRLPDAAERRRMEAFFAAL